MQPDHVRMAPGAKAPTASPGAPASPTAGSRHSRAAGHRECSASFEAELRRCCSDCGMSLSGHAWARLEQAGRSLTRPDIERLAGAIDAAGEKGARESLVLMDGLAFVVSVPNRTVITALGGSRLKEGVFTNIDSAVIIGGLDLNEGARGAHGRHRLTGQREVGYA
ncbi:MAG: TIGR02530 family flagellar biosynthesis protein [Bacillota bacterium]|nr:TIGR02530 family flagellar biosynthesis protein [Bacillota bacterium]